MLSGLAQRLSGVVARLSVPEEPLGRPELVAGAAAESARIFQGYMKALPSKDAAHTAALAFMQTQRLNELQMDLIACVLAESVPESGGGTPLGHTTFPALLYTFWRYAEDGNLPRLTWYAMLSSYFRFNPSHSNERDRAG